MRRRAVVALAAVAAAVPAVLAGGASAQQPCGGPLQPACPQPSPAPTATPAPVRVTLTASAREVDYGPPRSRAVRLTGRLSGVDDPEGVRVRLVGRSETFGRDITARETATGAGGRFTFTVRPSMNAVYDVAVVPGQGLEGRSLQRTVRVFPAVELEQSVSAGALVLRAVVTGPRTFAFADGARQPVRPGSSRRAAFYVQTDTTEGGYERIGRARLRTACRKGRCVRRARYEIRSSSLLGRAKRVLTCVPGRPFRGMGRPLECPARLPG